MRSRVGNHTIGPLSWLTLSFFFRYSGMRLRVVLAGKSKSILDALDGCGIKTDEDFLFSSSDLTELYRRLSGSVTFTELEEIRNTVLESLSAEGVVGNNLLQGNQLLQAGWTTSCPDLNIILEKVQSGIVEVAGPRGSAKTV